jgi:hypothetical protein
MGRCGIRLAQGISTNTEEHAMTKRRWIEGLVMQIQSVFLDDPTLCLTLPAAQRRFGLDEGTCAGVLGALVDARVLTEGEGAYQRSLPRPAVRPAA